ncbi:MAG: N-acetylmuramoyl-L-alanine amidase [Pseudomonadota bacterium]
MAPISDLPMSDLPRAVALAFERDGAAVTLSLSMTRRTDLRVFTLEAPRRVVLDLAGLAWALEAPNPPNAPAALSAPNAPNAGPVAEARLAQHPDGWGRLELVLDAPMRVAHVVYAPVPPDQPQALARLSLRLVPSSPEAFAAAAGPPLDPAPRRVVAPPPRPDRRLPLVVIDPGHGGIDPGAVRGRLVEKEIALRAARILAARLEATGRLRTRLTRDADVFLPLDARIGMAQTLRADLFVSVHANTEPTGTAWGVSVFTLSDAASDAAAARLARLENSADLAPQAARYVSAAEAPGAGEAPRSPEVTRILADLARNETNAASRRLAETVVRVLARSNRTLSGNPHRAAGFRVLRSAEIPSMLVELGFLTNAEDRARLASDAWLEAVSDELVAAILTWHADEPQRLGIARR